MEFLQKPGRIAGLWFLATFIFSIPAVLLYDPILNNAEYILGKGLDARISLGALFEILLAIANIVTAVVFFPVLKRVNETVALGYVASRIDRVRDDPHGRRQSDVGPHLARRPLRDGW